MVRSHPEEPLRLRVGLPPFNGKPVDGWHAWVEDADTGRLLQTVTNATVNIRPGGLITVTVEFLPDGIVIEDRELLVKWREGVRHDDQPKRTPP